MTKITKKNGHPQKLGYFVDNARENRRRPQNRPCPWTAAPTGGRDRTLPVSRDKDCQNGALSCGRKSISIRHTMTRDTKYLIRLVAIWLWPAILLSVTFHWHDPAVGLRLLSKSTWILFAGVLQSWVLYSFYISDQGWKADYRVWVLVGLSVASLFLLPFGLGRWEWAYSQFGRAIGWSYLENLLLSMFLHYAPYGIIKGLGEG